MQGPEILLALIVRRLQPSVECPEVMRAPRSRRLPSPRFRHDSSVNVVNVSGFKVISLERTVYSKGPSYVGFDSLFEA